MRLFTFTLFILFALSQYNYWYGKNGKLEYLALKRDVEKQRVQNEELTQRNERLFAEIRDLTTGYDAIEERARSELNMVKQGETFYRVFQK
ncbi:cell division protein FtsB [Thorsellia anophelis]|uniref:Cell division protein FtsB n=1 Tax=Thorsellia anophelis DSM 18579 TaxID=1123402 RepID=A0A1I0CAZ8_9GAMM|nr:cell division protein FtsB [Thorsellia anophelis]SET16289.1 cell division protein FtsB [Thorsellia anophelis DSM 18579]